MLGGDDAALDDGQQIPLCAAAPSNKHRVILRSPRPNYAVQKGGGRKESTTGSTPPPLLRCTESSLHATAGRWDPAQPFSLAVYP